MTFNKKLRVYIDGFNLYHAICEQKDHKLKWINFWKLSESFLKETEILDEVNFFTAVLTWNSDKQKRHVNFLKACRAVGVTVHEANFKRSFRYCKSQDRSCKFFEEKQTDVAIAVKMVSDAIHGNFDRAILITADSDQIPAASMIVTTLQKHLTLLYPPGRQTIARDLGGAVTDRKELTVGQMCTCPLPRSVKNQVGKVVATMPALYEEQL